MVEPEDVEKFWELFQGNPSAYGVAAGGSVQGDARDAVRRHLTEGVPCGIYPMLPVGDTDEAVVKWGCVDIDNDSYTDARSLYDMLHRMSLAPWLEVSKSKGFHVWVFAWDQVPARTMRRALMYAKDCCYLDHVKEVNPKAESFKGMQVRLGNYVNLPYVGGEADSNGRRVFILPEYANRTVTLGSFLREAYATAKPATMFDRWAARWRPPKPAPHLSAEAVELDDVVLSKCNKFIRKVLEEGPADWRFEGRGGRSGLLARMAHEARHSGLSAAEALGLLYACNKSWGKYTTEERAAKYLHEMRDEAYR